MKIYKYNEWTFINHFDYDLNIYTDLDGNPITGILEDFKYFKENDPRNNQYVENGKRVYDYIQTN
ncbi:MAG: hypothetical protein M0R17_02610 [Candidatus Omnitrophica bacterium]|jgi:hypothetical protein|nr:hypothetical protein [Candidatus Omnitrophota bacterium]